MKNKLSIIAAIFLFASTAHAEGIGTLKDIARSQAEAQKDYARETGNFESAKRALADGSFMPGEAKHEVRKRCGLPSVAFEKKGDTPETWIYKAASSSYFGGEKIYLAFDAKGILTDIKTANEPKEDKE